MPIAQVKGMQKKPAPVVFRAINWLGVIASLPLLILAGVDVADSPILPEHVISAGATLLFPVLSLIGLTSRPIAPAGMIGLVLMVSVRSATAFPAPGDSENRAYAAVRSGNAQALRAALAAGADPDVYSEDRGYLLSAAVARGDPDIIRVLIDAGADVNVRKANWSTPLLKAVYLEQCEAARLLLEAGASPTDRFYDYWHYTDPPTYYGKTVHEIYRGRKAERNMWRTEDGDCWRTFEARLNDPPPSRWTARRLFQDAVLVFLR